MSIDLDFPIIIHGRPLNSQRLTPEVLQQLGLQPIKKLEVEGREILLSPIFETPRKRLGCIAYIRDENGFVARTFFFSRSQGVWRLMRRYRFEIKDGREHVTWHDKGYGEESLLVPLAVQKEIADLEIMSTGNELLELAFYGTSLSVDEQDAYEVLINKEPRKLTGNFYPEQRRQKIAPELLTFSDTQEAPLYGPLNYFVFESHDKTLKCMFIKTHDGRAWVGGAESNGEITPLGIRKSWVSAGNLTTPLYEYLGKWDEVSRKFLIDQTGGYGNPEDRRGHYVDMWKNYLSKVPFLQKFKVMY